MSAYTPAAYSASVFPSLQFVSSSFHTPCDAAINGLETRRRELQLKRSHLERRRSKSRDSFGSSTGWKGLRASIGFGEESHEPLEPQDKYPLARQRNQQLLALVRNAGSSTQAPVDHVQGDLKIQQAKARYMEAVQQGFTAHQLQRELSHMEQLQQLEREQKEIQARRVASQEIFNREMLLYRELDQKRREVALAKEQEHKEELLRQMRKKYLDLEELETDRAIQMVTEDVLRSWQNQQNSILKQEAQQKVMFVRELLQQQLQQSLQLLHQQQAFQLNQAVAPQPIPLSPAQQRHLNSSQLASDQHFTNNSQAYTLQQSISQQQSLLNQFNQQQNPQQQHLQVPPPHQQQLASPSSQATATTGLLFSQTPSIEESTLSLPMGSERMTGQSQKLLADLLSLSPTPPSRTTPPPPPPPSQHQQPQQQQQQQQQPQQQPVSRPAL